MTDPRALATEQLAPGEHLLWSGSSDPAVLFTGRDAFLVPFSIVWTGFVVTGLVTSITNGEQFGFGIVWMIPFVLIGFHLLVGRFLVKARRKRAEAYAVTDRRVFVTNGRSTHDTSVHRTDRTVRWSGGRTRCSVEWETGNSGFGSFFGNRSFATVYANTGLDGFFGPRQVAFWDVRDGEAMIAAFDRAGRG